MIFIYIYITGFIISFLALPIFLDDGERDFDSLTLLTVRTLTFALIWPLFAVAMLPILISMIPVKFILKLKKRS